MSYGRLVGMEERIEAEIAQLEARSLLADAEAIEEAVFGQVVACQGGRQLLLRGEDGARGG